MLKAQLHQHCLGILQHSLEIAKQDLKLSQAAKNNETKSPMGDKHETSRALHQTSEDQKKRVLAQTQSLLQQMQSINPAAQNQSIKKGSLVKTDQGIFYLAVALGKINFQNQNLWVISLASPIGQALFQKKQGDSFSLNGKDYRILNLF